MQINWGRTAGWAIAGPAALALLTGCGVVPGGSVEIMVDGTAAAAVGTTPSPAPSGSSDPSAAPPVPGAVGVGCPPGGAAVPNGAGVATTQDLDGDGLADDLWLSRSGGRRMLGVETASGARFFTTFTGDGLAPLANAVAGRVDGGTAVILLDFTSQARLYTVTGCKIVKTMNQLGEQYAFDEEMTYGTGAGCPAIGAGGTRRLVGYLAKPVGSGAGYSVTRTIIELSRNGTRARNGTEEKIADGVPGSHKRVREGQEIICGPGGRALEPADG